MDQKAGYEIWNVDGYRIPVRVPNDVYGCDGFYVSYNDHDTALYGSDTTALVTGQMEHFYILNGNHIEAYRALLPSGIDACLAYFEEHSAEMNFRSEPAPTRGVPKL